MASVNMLFSGIVTSKANFKNPTKMRNHPKTVCGLQRKEMFLLGSAKQKGLKHHQS